MVALENERFESRVTGSTKMNSPINCGRQTSVPSTKHQQNQLPKDNIEMRCQELVFEPGMLTISFDIFRKLPLKLAVEKGLPKLMPTVA
jgi:hypothetical protein